MQDDDDFLSQVAADAGNLNIDVETDKLKSISKLALRQKLAEQKVRSLELQLKEAKAELLSISQGELPQLMSDIGLKEFKLEDGSKITIDHDISVTIKNEDKEEAYCWLEDNGHEDLIKAHVAVEFGKKEYHLAIKFAEKIKKLTNKQVEFDKDVHWQTLKAWTKEYLKEREKDKDLPKLPEDLFTVFAFSKAKIETPKKVSNYG